MSILSEFDERANRRIAELESAARAEVAKAWATAREVEANAWLEFGRVKATLADQRKQFKAFDGLSALAAKAFASSNPVVMNLRAEDLFAAIKQVLALIKDMPASAEKDRLFQLTLTWSTLRNDLRLMAIKLEEQKRLREEQRATKEKEKQDRDRADAQAAAAHAKAQARMQENIKEIKESNA